MSEVSLDELVARCYPARLYFDSEDSVYVVEYPDLPGCHAYGDSVAEAYNNAEQAKQEWMRESLSRGLPIPKPTEIAQHSGRILLRLPPSLHSLLSERAQFEGVSLNAFVVHLLSIALAGDQISGNLRNLANQIDELRRHVAALTLKVELQPSILAGMGSGVPHATKQVHNVLYSVADEPVTDSPKTQVEQTVMDLIGGKPGRIDLFGVGNLVESKRRRSSILGSLRRSLKPKAS